MVRKKMSSADDTSYSGKMGDPENGIFMDGLDKSVTRWPGNSCVRFIRTFKKKKKYFKRDNSKR